MTQGMLVSVVNFYWISRMAVPALLLVACVGCRLPGNPHLPDLRESNEEISGEDSSAFIIRPQSVGEFRDVIAEASPTKKSEKKASEPREDQKEPIENRGKQRLGFKQFLRRYFNTLRAIASTPGEFVKPPFLVEPSVRVGDKLPIFTGNGGRITLDSGK